MDYAQTTRGYVGLFMVVSALTSVNLARADGLNTRTELPPVADIEVGRAEAAAMRSKVKSPHNDSSTSANDVLVSTDPSNSTQTSPTVTSVPGTSFDCSQLIGNQTVTGAAAANVSVTIVADVITNYCRR